MKDLEKEIKGYSALQLALEYNRLLALADEDDSRLVSLFDAKKLLYVEEALQEHLYEQLPTLPKVELCQQSAPGEEVFNELLGSYFKRKPNAKKQSIEKRLRFFIKVSNNLNVTIASIPVMAVNKAEALEIAKGQSQKLGSGKLEFKIS